MASNNGLHSEVLKWAEEHFSTSSSPTSSAISIHEISDMLRKVKHEAYSPRVVSIGLINHHKIKVEDLKISYEDGHKKIYMFSLFQRTLPPPQSDERTTTLRESEPFKNVSERIRRFVFDETVQLVVDSMITKAGVANNCYPVSYRNSEPERTAETMLLDGCFILELLIRWTTGSTDSIIQTRSDLNNIVHDLLLVENQIPFLVLEELFKLTFLRFPQYGLSNLPRCSSLLKNLILNFFCDEKNSHFKSVKIPSEPLSDQQKIKHMLGLVHSSYCPPQKPGQGHPQKPGQGHPQKPGQGHPHYMVTRYSATELIRSGIKLKPSKNEKVYLDVRFNTHCLFSWFPSIITSIFLFPWRLAIFIYKTIFHSSSPSASRKYPYNIPEIEEDEIKSARASCCWLSLMCQFCRRATLEIPELHITDSTESFLRNLIAYEQTDKEIPNYITSYAFLMDTIVNTKDDIQMLETSGVLKNYLATSTVASDLFNNLCVNVILGDKFYFFEQWKQVDDYCKLYWANQLGSLKYTYFSNPWTGISVFAALVLFAFTGLQTTCTVIQTWYKK